MIVSKNIQKKLISFLLVVTLLSMGLLPIRAHAEEELGLSWFEVDNLAVGPTLDVIAHIRNDRNLDQLTVNVEDRSFPMQSDYWGHHFEKEISFTGLESGYKKVTVRATSTSGVTEEISRTVYYEPKPTYTFEFETLAQMVIEESGIATVKVIRKGNSHGTVYAWYFTHSRSAEKGIDFFPNLHDSQDQKIIFKDGETSQTIKMRLTDDSIPEGLENFRVDLTRNNKTYATTNVIIRDQD
ncbi:hypothetical protein GK047_13705 [Paenibacillus sp. SYP-B3998]|uniref:Calx-beta domain-containing protein n=1 Tax=Paenibacillus sp. SYP-B3998 TaxID=2678564 RepID=A0A6G3ZY46_9BACL|nr:Calx-beta domain-containing protein [Paenibacillus sp. SYP-B3998]NEW07062.1 hypothetical protein [Paenibacillus sp. SYP-B3998]